LRKVIDTPLPVTMVGSYPRPLWYKDQLHGQDIQHAFKLEERHQAYEDATAACIRDQEEAGLDIVTDGQMYFDDYGGSIGSFVWYWYERLPGFYHNKMLNPIAMSGQTDATDFDMMNNWGGTITTGPIERGPGRLAELYKIARSLTDKPLKVSVGAGPLNLGIHVYYDRPESYYKNQRDLAYALAPVFNAEMKELVAAGADFIQLEDLGAWIPIMSGNDEDFEWIVDVVNQTIEGVDAKVAWHFCLGTAYGNTFEIFEGMLGRILEPLYDTHVEQFVLDFALRDMQDVGALSGLPEDKEVAAGVIDVRSMGIESDEEVAERMRSVLEVVPHERVSFTTDCGMRVLPRLVAKEKLKSLVRGAQIIRAEVPSSPSRGTATV
jgi:5-methyltetrahydropteroyltriglutamate--homocysteine methyltransferase